jgi:hypothetical protein
LIDNPLLVVSIPVVKYVADTYHQLDYLPLRKKFLVDLGFALLIVVLVKFL